MKGKLRYESIYTIIKEAIVSGSLQNGIVLLEGPLASLFGTSRVPVRRALGILCDEKLISRFDGRGFVVGDFNSAGIEPIRQAITKHDLGIHDDNVDNRSLSEKILADLFEAISTCMVFGHYKVDEELAAKYYGVSKMVIRQSLLMLRDRGIVEKEPYSSWFAGPLTARQIKDDYDIRSQLEPAALMESYKFVDVGLIKEMLLKHECILKSEDKSVNDLFEIDDFIHVEMIKNIRNKKILDILNHCRSSTVLNKIFFSCLKHAIDINTIKEHKLILELVLQGSIDAAASSLRVHLKNSQKRSLQRLKVVSILPEPEFPSYIVKI